MTSEIVRHRNDLKERRHPLADFAQRAQSLIPSIRDKSQRDAYLKTIAAIDSAKIAELQEKYRHALEGDWTEPGTKYLDTPFVIMRHVRPLSELGLDKSVPLRILDIGSAGGHFIFSCSLFGHHTQGVDVSIPIFNDISKALGTNICHCELTHDSDLTSFGRFDLITLMGIALNYRIIDGIKIDWTKNEWFLFLNRLIETLDMPGRVYLSFNRTISYDVIELMRRQGAVIDEDRPSALFSFDEKPDWAISAIAVS